MDAGGGERHEEAQAMGRWGSGTAMPVLGQVQLPCAGHVSAET